MYINGSTDYSSHNASNSGRLRPSMTTGKKSVKDIPVNIKLDVSSNEKNQFLLDVLNKKHTSNSLAILGIMICFMIPALLFKNNVNFISVISSVVSMMYCVCNNAECSEAIQTGLTVFGCAKTLYPALT